MWFHPLVSCETSGLWCIWPQEAWPGIMKIWLSYFFRNFSCLALWATSTLPFLSHTSPKSFVCHWCSSLSPNKYFLILQVPPFFRGRLTGMDGMEPSLTPILFWWTAWGVLTDQGRITWLLGKKNASSLHFFSWSMHWGYVRSRVRTR